MYKQGNYNTATYVNLKNNVYHPKGSNNDKINWTYHGWTRCDKPLETSQQIHQDSVLIWTTNEIPITVLYVKTPKVELQDALLTTQLLFANIDTCNKEPLH